MHLNNKTTYIVTTLLLIIIDKSNSIQDVAIQSVHKEHRLIRVIRGDESTPTPLPGGGGNWGDSPLSSASSGASSDASSGASSDASSGASSGVSSGASSAEPGGPPNVGPGRPPNDGSGGPPNNGSREPPNDGLGSQNAFSGTNLSALNDAATLTLPKEQIAKFVSGILTMKPTDPPQVLFSLPVPGVAVDKEIRLSGAASFAAFWPLVSFALMCLFLRY